MKKIIVPAALEQIDVIQEFVGTELEAVGFPIKEQTRLSIALDEILSNIVYYAYPDGKGDIGVSCDAEGGQVTVVIEDGGIPYNPLEKDDPDVTLSAEERKIGGLGIFMVKKIMDDVRYEYTDGKNTLTIQKNTY